MKILDLIYKIAHQQGLDFLLIGGHAINAIGDRRQTRDVDLAVCKMDREQWKKLLKDMDYEVFNDSDAFLQFSPPDIAQWPVDILLVDKQTFDELIAEGRAVNLGGEYDILIPSSKHMISMKLHTLKQGDPIRRLKDLLDIIMLVRSEKIDIQDNEFKQLCEKYATEKDYEEIIKLFSEH